MSKLNGMQSTVKKFLFACSFVTAACVRLNASAELHVELHEKEPLEALAPSSVSITPGYTFRKEPKYSNPDIFHALLKVGNDPSLHVPLAWDAKARTLYLDLNRNGDLSDDGKGWPQTEGSTFGPVFRNIPLSFPEGSNNLVVFADMEAMTISNRLCATAWIRPAKCWEGFVEIENVRWSVRVLDSFFNHPANNGRLPFSYLFSPEGLSTVSKNLGVPPSDNARIFLQNQFFQITPRLVQTSSGQKRFLILSPEPIPMGTIRLKGEYLRWIYLAGAQTVHIFNPPPEINLPSGSYISLTALLHNGKHTGQAITKFSSIDIPEGKIIELPAGGPLEHRVSAVSQHISIEIAYELVNKFNQPFTLVKTFDTKPPRLKIIHNGHVLREDDFRYG